MFISPSPCATTRPGTGAGARAIQAGDFQYPVGANRITGVSLITTDGGDGTSEALFTLSSNVTATEAVTPSVFGVTVASSIRDKNPLDAANPYYPWTTHSPLVSDTHRVTDVGLGLNVGPEYGVVEPVFAKDQTVGPATPGVGYINVFDGSKWLNLQNITVEGRIHTLGVAYPAVELWYDVGVASSLTAANDANLPLWLPPFLTTDFNGLVPNPNASAVAKTSGATTQIQDIVIPHNTTTDPKVVDGALIQFLFQIQSGGAITKNLYTAHVLDPNATDWYRHVVPWAFQIHNIKLQRSGVQILNNVINPDKGDVATLNYTTSTAGPVRILVFDLAGNIVNSLKPTDETAGDHAVTWNGTNRNGAKVARGIYFIRIVAPGIDEIRKVLVVR